MSLRTGAALRVVAGLAVLAAAATGLVSGSGGEPATAAGQRWVAGWPTRPSAMWSS